MNALSGAETPRTIEEIDEAFTVLVAYSEGMLGLMLAAVLILVAVVLAFKILDLATEGIITLIERRRLMQEIAEIDRTGDPR